MWGYVRVFALSASPQSVGVTLGFAEVRCKTPADPHSTGKMGLHGARSDVGPSHQASTKEGPVWPLTPEGPPSRLCPIAGLNDVSDGIVELIN